MANVSLDVECFKSSGTVIAEGEMCECLACSLRDGDDVAIGCATCNKEKKIQIKRVRT